MAYKYGHAVQYKHRFQHFHSPTLLTPTPRLLHNARNIRTLFSPEGYLYNDIYLLLYTAKNQIRNLECYRYIYRILSIDEFFHKKMIYFSHYCRKPILPIK